MNFYLAAKRFLNLFYIGIMREGGRILHSDKLIRIYKSLYNSIVSITTTPNERKIIY